jgi:serine/threonine protein kinase
VARLGRAIRVSTLEGTALPSLPGSADAPISSPVRDVPTRSCAWNERFAKALPTIFELLPCRELLSAACLVDKGWNKAARTAFSWKVASEMDNRCTQRAGEGASDVPIFESWNGFLSAFPWGHYLADGAYKQVYKVYNRALRRQEAISIMDVASLAEGSNLPIVQAEIQVSCLVSELIHNCVCPNFVETYQIFLHRFSPGVHFPWHWGTAEDRYPQGKTHPLGIAKPIQLKSRPRVGNGEFQYIRMELCSGGDVENQLRDFETHVEIAMREPTEAAAETLVGSLTALRVTAAARASPVVACSPSSTSSMASWIVHTFFQMVVSMFASRSRLHLRHYDIKCLNFFVLGAADTLWMQGQPSDKSLALSYQFGPITFTLNCVPAVSWLRPGIIKLADFGTADTNASSLGKPIKSYHITTVENSPPEFFMWGNTCVQAYSIDTWALGLCFLHLLTGAAPYEEMMESIFCPEAVMQKLRLIWEGEAFRVLWPFLEDCTDRTMCDTLYRFFVLAGQDTLPTAYLCESDVGKLLLSLVDSPGCDCKSWRIPAQPLAKCRKLYKEHTGIFSIRTGRHPMLVRARDRLACVPGGMEALLEMTHWDPAARPTMKSLICSDMFACLSKNVATEGAVVAQFALDASVSLHDVPDF